MEEIKLSQCPVPILQDEWEFQTFMKMYVEKQPKKIIEIGSFFGGTLYFWLMHNKNLESLTSIDLSIPPSDGRYNQMRESKKLWESWATAADLIDFHTIEGDSKDLDTIREAKRLYPDNDIDMLFIDGDHSYKAVKADYNNYKSLVKPGGWIVFHDIIGIGDVNKAWTEVVSQADCKSIVISRQRYGWGIGIIEV